MTRRERRIARHVRLASSLERALAHDIRKMLNRIALAASKHVANGQAYLAASAVEHETHLFIHTFRARLQTAAMASAELVAEELAGSKAASGLETKFLNLIEIARRSVASWLSSYAAEKVRQIGDTTRKIIRRSLVRGNELNEPPRVLAKRVKEETGGAIGARRALTIARTEIHIAANVGSNSAADASGLVLNKEWGATEDSRTRFDHAIADGQVVGQDEMFMVGGFPMAFPGDPDAPAREVINCRCVLLWHPRIPT